MKMRLRKFKKKLCDGLELFEVYYNNLLQDMYIKYDVT